jgi:alginate O-acetyltransferase complex protein AlgI
MQFNSFEYLFAFLPIVVTLYWIFRTSVISKYVVFVGSCIFYGWIHPWFLIPMFGSTIVDYIIAQKIHDTLDERIRRRLLWTSISFSLSLMCFFKYVEWVTQGLAGLGPIAGFALLPAPVRVILPPGISFYTFETISYTIDVYRGDFKPRRKLLDYLTFIVFFPHLVAGPIRRARDLLPVLASYRPSITWEAANQAIFFIVWGILLKVVFADNCGAIVENITTTIRQSGTLPAGYGIVFAYAFAFQIYCDFAAYSLIARGSALLFGVDVQRNFLTPYFASNPSDFWQRWHISLSTWLRDYLYVPLGGNQRGLLTTVRNLFVVMVLGGLWHGGGVFFILWGLWHGLLLAFYRVCPIDEWLTRAFGVAGKAFSILLFFHLVCFGWILFRSNIHDFPILMESIASLSFRQPHLGMPNTAVALGWWVCIFGMPVILSDFVGYLHRCEFPDLWSATPLAGRVLLLVAIFYAIVFFGARQANEFIYFAF